MNSSSIPNLIQAIKQAVFNPHTTELDAESQAAVDSLISQVIADNGGAAASKLYSALISQTGTSAPTVTITRINNTGGTPVYAYVGVGSYTLAGITTTALKNKTTLIKGANGAIGQITMQVVASDLIAIKTYSSAGTATDGILVDFNIQVNVAD